VDKLIITPEILALQAEWRALEATEKESDELPPKVAAFWNAPEPWIPPWRPIEWAEERAQSYARLRNDTAGTALAKPRRSVHEGSGVFFLVQGVFRSRP
jgi:hypothetical protein